MKLDLSEIARTLGMRFHYVIDEPAIADETVTCLEPIKGTIDFANTGSAIIAKGEFSTAVELECGRCLKHFAIPIESEIDEQLEIAPVFGEAEEEVQEPDPVIEGELERIFEDNFLDLRELLRQTLVIDMPIRPLCDDACKGLCPNCGQNLNDTQCECNRSEVSGALGKLAEMWKAKQDEQE